MCSQQPFWVPEGDAEIDVHFWRQTDGRKVWYEWSIEGFFVLNDIDTQNSPQEGHGMSRKRVKYGMSEIHNVGGKGSNMIIT